MSKEVEVPEEQTAEALAMQEIAQEIVTLKEQIQALMPKTDASIGGGEPDALQKKLEGMSYNQLVKFAREW